MLGPLTPIGFSDLVLAETGSRNERLQEAYIATWAEAFKRAALTPTVPVAGEALDRALANNKALRKGLADCLVALRTWGAQEDGMPDDEIVQAYTAYVNGATLLSWAIVIDPSRLTKDEATTEGTSE